MRSDVLPHAVGPWMTFNAPRLNVRVPETESVKERSLSDGSAVHVKSAFLMPMICSD